MQDTLVKFVKDRKGRRVGCVLAKKFPDNNWIFVSGSLCNMKKEDGFDRLEAVQRAERRTLRHAREGRVCQLAHSLKPDIIQMIEMAKEHFKTTNVIASHIK